MSPPYVPTEPGALEDEPPRRIVGRSVSRTEADVLASMMSADSRRVDVLVDDVSDIKGDVKALKSDTARIGTGVEQLQASMVALNKHSMLLEAQQATNAERARKHDLLDNRVKAIELEMPALKETRTWVTRGGLFVLGFVGLALLGLVVKSVGS